MSALDDDMERYFDAKNEGEIPTWTTEEGKTLFIEDMDDRHLVNTVKMMRNKGFVSCEEYQHLVNEVVFRQIRAKLR